MAKYGEKASEKVEKSDAREERRNTQKWTIRQEGEKPQTGDRHRTVGSPTRWGQGSAPEIFVEKEVNSENHSDHFRQMKSQAIRCLRDLLPATEPVGYNQSLGARFHVHEADPLTSLDRNLMVLLFKTESANHSATACIDGSKSSPSLSSIFC
jgi:hypothetical protein